MFSYSPYVDLALFSVLFTINWLCWNKHCSGIEEPEEKRIIRFMMNNVLPITFRIIICLELMCLAWPIVVNNLKYLMGRFYISVVRSTPYQSSDDDYEN